MEIFHVYLNLLSPKRIMIQTQNYFSLLLKMAQHFKVNMIHFVRMSIGDTLRKVATPLLRVACTGTFETIAIAPR